MPDAAKRNAIVLLTFMLGEKDLVINMFIWTCSVECCLCCLVYLACLLQWQDFHRQNFVVVLCNQLHLKLGSAWSEQYHEDLLVIVWFTEALNL